MSAEHAQCVRQGTGIGAEPQRSKKPSSPASRRLWSDRRAEKRVSANTTLTWVVEQKDVREEEVTGSLEKRVQAHDLLFSSTCSYIAPPPRTQHYKAISGLS